MGIGLYIHIPFCKQKCNYCDFNSGPFRSADLDQYVVLLEQESALYFKQYGALEVETIFIGGGTPSVLETAHILSIGKTLKSYFDLSTLKEFTFEANPESVTVEKAEAFKAIGANRVSIGLQTANDAELFAISRIHDWQTFLKTYQIFRQTGYDNINIDLMIGLPGQTKESYLDSLEKVIALEPDHLSNYGLIIEDETPLANQVSKGLVTILDGDHERDLYHLAAELLEEKGYSLYEISNFSKNGKHCFHNINYWRCGEYAALGVGAHGYLNGERFENAITLENYAALLKGGERPLIHTEAIGLKEREQEYIMLGLRMSEGIDAEHYKMLFGKNPFEIFESVIKKYEETGHLLTTDKGFSLTLDGMDISNAIIIDFFECFDSINE